MGTFKNDPSFGQLFKNRYKEDGDKKPDYKGTMTDPNGVEWQIAGWIKDGANGKFLSLKIQEPYVKPESNVQNPPSAYDDDEDIPF